MLPGRGLSPGRAMVGCGTQPTLTIQSKNLKKYLSNTKLIPTESPMLKNLQMNSTDRLIINVMEAVDLEEVRILHNDDSTLEWLTDPTHVSPLMQEQWYQEISLSSTSQRYIARLKKDQTFVGVFRIDRMDLRNSSAIVGADVVPELRRQGMATEMFKYFLDYLFRGCGLNRLGLETLAINTGAIKMYKRLGFKQEGQLRKAIFRKNMFQELILMGLLREEWSDMQ
jgi:RimJ/RimL family protein N-acetyltransferase